MIYINISFDHEEFQLKPTLKHWGDETVFQWLFFQAGIDWYK